MSAFLGPIHFWLYKKIQFQNEINKTIVEKSSLENKYEILGNEDLAEIIDESNIHGYLQGLVNIVEKNYSLIVDDYLKSNDISDLKEILYKFGEEKSLENNAPVELFNEMGNILLDGMPCDRALEIIESGDDYVKWNIAQCVHTPFWDDVSVYYDLRNEIIKGLLSNTDYDLYVDELYTIK